MDKIFVFITVLMLSLPCLAAPSKVDSNKWLDEFRTAQANGGDALILNNREKRIALIKEMQRIRDRSEKLFGQFSECTSSADGLVSNYMDEIELVVGSKNAHITASGLARSAWINGENFSICEARIEAMK